VMEMQEPLGKRLGRFVALLAVVFTVALVVVVTQRLSQDSLALLIGLTCGVAAMLPTLLLGVIIWRREMRQQQAQRMPMATPPVVIVTPQGLPNYGMQQPALSDGGYAWPWSAPQQPARTFTIVGDEE
jgi:Na+/proline symporter